MSKRILILGVGNAQLDLILLCRELNFTIYAISYKDEGIGRQFADHFEVIDILDIDTVLDFVKRHSIDLLYSVGSDIAMPTIAYVSEKLELTFYVDFKTAEMMQSKFKMRQFL